MGFTSGLGATLQIEKESAYGTFKKPENEKKFEFEEAPFKGNEVYLPGAQLGALSLFQKGTRYINTQHSADGTVKMQIPTQGFGQWLNMLHGEKLEGATLKKEGSGTVYKQIHKIGTTDPSTKSWTIQVKTPMVTGATEEPFSYLGSVVMKADFDITTTAYATATFAFDCQKEVRSESLATATLAAGIESYNFSQAELKVNGTKRSLAHDVKISLTIPRDTNRFYLSQGGYKELPLINQYADVMIASTNDYGDNVLFDYFKKGERKSVEVILKGKELESEVFKQVIFKMPECAFEQASPSVTGPGIITQNPQIKALYNGTEPPLTVEYWAEGAGEKEV